MKALRLRRSRRCRRRTVAAWACTSVLSLAAALAAVLLPASGQAAAGAPAWTLQPARQAPEGADRLAAAGWACTQSVSWPGPAVLQVSLCRQRGAPADVQLQLVAHDGHGDGARVMARLADASRAGLHLFVPPQPCAASGAACLDGVLLVDQRDEGSCYGTQVFVRVDEGLPRSAGFLGELRVHDGEERCIGAQAQVSGAGDEAVIELAAPLWRVGGPRGPVALKAVPVRYRLKAGTPTLQRQPAAPR